MKWNRSSVVGSPQVSTASQDKNAFCAPVLGFLKCVASNRHLTWVCHSLYFVIRATCSAAFNSSKYLRASLTRAPLKRSRTSCSVVPPVGVGLRDSALPLFSTGSCVFHFSLSAFRK